jgi:outer membrane protein assembly factor BamB
MDPFFKRIGILVRGLFVVFIIVTFLAITGLLDQRNVSTNSGPRNIPTSKYPANRKAISSSFSGVSTIWRVSTGKPNIEPLPYSPYLFIHNNKVITGWFASPDDSNLNTSVLTAIALDSGKTVWQTEYHSDHTTITFSTYMDEISNRLFLAYAYSIGAFDLDTGKEMWKLDDLAEPRKNCSFDFLQKQHDTVSLLVDHDAVFVGKFTGQVVSRTQTAYDSSTVVIDDNIAITNQSVANYSAGLVAKNRDGVVLWQRPAVMITGQPVLLGNATMLVPYGNALWSMIKMNYKTGEVYWSTGGFVSNFFVWGDKVLALRQDGALVFLDVNTGQDVGKIFFDHDFSAATGEKPFFVVASGPYIVVYFGDTQELVALKFGNKVSQTIDANMQK